MKWVVTLHSWLSPFSNFVTCYQRTKNGCQYLNHAITFLMYSRTLVIAEWGLIQGLPNFFRCLDPWAWSEQGFLTGLTINSSKSWETRAVVPRFPVTMETRRWIITRWTQTFIKIWSTTMKYLLLGSDKDLGSLLESMNDFWNVYMYRNTKGKCK